MPRMRKGRRVRIQRTEFRTARFNRLRAGRPLNTLVNAVPSASACRQGLSVKLADPRFRREEKGSTHLHTTGPERHGRCDASAISDAPCGDHRHTDGIADLRYQRQCALAVIPPAGSKTYRDARQPPHPAQ